MRSRARSGIRWMKPEQVLVGIAEAHAAADARFKVGGGAGEVEGDHHLVGVPDVDHAVGMEVGVSTVNLSEQSLPVGF